MAETVKALALRLNHIFAGLTPVQGEVLIVLCFSKIFYQTFRANSNFSQTDVNRRPVPLKSEGSKESVGIWHDHGPQWALLKNCT